MILLLRDYTINQFHTYQLSPINMKSPNFQTLTQSQDCSLKNPILLLFRPSLDFYFYHENKNNQSQFTTCFFACSQSIHLHHSDAILLWKVKSFNFRTVTSLFQESLFFNFTINQVQIQRTKFQSGKISK